MPPGADVSDCWWLLLVLLEVTLGLLVTLTRPGLAGGVLIEGPGLGGYVSVALKLGTFSRTVLDFRDTTGVLVFLLSFLLNWKQSVSFCSGDGDLELS